MNGTTDYRWQRRIVAWAMGGWIATVAPAARSLFADQPAAPAIAPINESVAPVPAVDPPALTTWVQQLDDDRYAVREAAQKRLAAAGAPAMATVGEVAATGSLESSTRCVSVLLSWADAKDNALSVAALERLASLTNHPLEAARAFDRLADVREAAAIQAIKGFGGRFDYDRTSAMVGGNRPPLQVIIGPQWKGGTDGLRQIAAVRSATTLSLHSAPLDDAAATELMELTQLRRMELYGTGLSEDAVAKIKTRLPDVNLDIRGGARLGIQGLQIERIVQDSPAQKAGLKEQDRIAEFAGQPIETFEQLTQQIAKCKPGDSVPIKALRPNPTTGKVSTVELTVTFDRWGDDERTTMGAPEGQDPFGQPPGVQRTIILQPGGIPQPQRPFLPNRR